ncbi:DUF3291 domain-containing protein [Geojedonia litorea]|uniref:DUF3291 domain-containing protein n=1 Tax=Geojedonia litorea TaxID=1268269 RepID=A0ABV9N341_9FLAO
MYHLAQVNIAKTLAPMEDPIMADFVNNLDRINTLAESSLGFVWRLESDDDDTVAETVFGDNSLVINMSVWKSIDDLFNFTYKSDHVEIFARRKEWFSKIDSMHMVCWYVKQDHIPTLEEAKHRLEYVNTHGETPFAFTFKRKYSVDDYLNHNLNT